MSGKVNNKEEHNQLAAYDFDDFVTFFENIYIYNEYKYKEELYYNPLISSTGACEIAITVREEIPTKRVHISGHIVLNQCGTILTRQTHKIKGMSKHELFLHNFTPVSLGKSLPLLYLDRALFVTIFWYMNKYQCSVLGAMPDPLLSYSMSSLGFVLILQHFW